MMMMMICALMISLDIVVGKNAVAAIQPYESYLIQQHPGYAVPIKSLTGQVNGKML